MTLMTSKNWPNWSGSMFPVLVLGVLLLFQGFGWITLDAQILLAAVYVLPAASVAHIAVLAVNFMVIMRTINK